MIWLPIIYDEAAGLTDHGLACLFHFWSYSTMRILVGSSRLPFIPMGSGGIQRMTGFFSGNKASATQLLPSSPAGESKRASGFPRSPRIGPVAGREKRRPALIGGTARGEDWGQRGPHAG